ncbi:hypothetical protein GPECTOR_22g792 [Gonium pectorale]|uniref:PAS domain-containing protein n=1 Tax=Gonium pectorale TaxID=33097 RepID=A0A150GH80_GONPE|nr:hypothetical protein GPECTOR_22g792 [Gonium pectorale]|eukprot:KXZ49202.1 hypothetical protein GPECTOR_22g792 [Gonium pectorale]
MPASVSSLGSSGGGGSNLDLAIWRVVSFQRLGEFLSTNGYTFYLALLYTFVSLLAISVALATWLAYCLANNRIPHPLTMHWLRWYGVVFTQVLYITSLTLLLVALDCNYFDVPKGVKFFNFVFPQEYCWSMPHLVHVFTSGVAIVVFVFLAGAMLVSEMELNPLTRNFMAINNTKVEGIGFIIITIATLASVTVNDVRYLSILYVIIFSLLNYLTVKWVPFIHRPLNYARCGAYAAVLYSSGMLAVLVFGGKTGGVRDRLTTARDGFACDMTLALWVGLAPAALVGALACHARLFYFSRFVADRFRTEDLDLSRQTKRVYKFSDAREVEIAARCARRWLDEDTVDPDAMALSEIIIKSGMTQLPQDPMMIILYSSFLIDVQGSYQSGYAQLQGAKTRSPGPLERFAIYSREQDHTSRSLGVNAAGGPVDLISYVELVTRAHKDALIAIRNFWALLLRSNVEVRKISRQLQRIEVAVKSAERAYRGVLSRHSKNARLVRLYGKFLETVKLDPWAASKWFSEADRLNELAAHAKETMQLGGLELGLLPRDAAAGAQRSLADAEGLGLIFINAQGQIQAASQEAHTMLGYNKDELQGRDVGIIMPPPFGDSHTTYVRNFIQTGGWARRVRDAGAIRAKD